MKRILVIDVGSNSVKCSAYSYEKEIVREWHETRVLALLSKIKDGEMSAEGEDMLCRTLADYSDRAEKSGGTEVFAFATASLRALTSPCDFIEKVAARTGIRIKLISGEEEAAYSYAGIKSKLGDSAENGIMADMGGGSTEVITYENGAIKQAVSIPFGALVLKNKFVRGNLPNADEAEAIAKYAREAFMKVAREYKKIVLVGGTAKCFGALAKKDGTEMSALQFDRALTFLLNDSAYQKRAARLFPERFPLIAPGAIALRELVRACNSDTILTTAGGLRDGIAHEILINGDNK